MLRRIRSIDKCSSYKGESYISPRAYGLACSQYEQVQCAGISGHKISEAEWLLSPGFVTLTFSGLPGMFRCKIQRVHYPQEKYL